MLIFSSNPHLKLIEMSARLKAAHSVIDVKLDVNK